MPKSKSGKSLSTAAPSTSPAAARPILAPGLPRSLPIPRGFPKFRVIGTQSLATGLLSSLGLSEQQVTRLECEILQWKDNVARFEAVPRNGNLPAPEQNLEHQSFFGTPDIAEFGIFQLYARVVLSEPDAVIVRDFVAWLKAQRRLLGFQHWGKQPRNPAKFARDLVVFVLSESGEWSVDQIDVQLRYLGLPGLARSNRTDAKAVVRKIRFDIRRLLAKSKRSVLSPEV